jgi:hypothetical protein
VRVTDGAVVYVPEGGVMTGAGGGLIPEGVVEEPEIV